jgi:hypothetical protein
MTEANADFTVPDRTTASRTPANAHAASVPTAYSAVVMPASAARRIVENLVTSVHFTLRSSDG